MRYCDKITANLYGVQLELGVIEPKQGHRISCYFVVENPHDKEFIEKQARQLLVAGCRNFDIYGKYNNEWHNEITLEDIRLNPESIEETVAITNSYDSLVEFIDSIKVNISLHSFIPIDHYLIYDDYELYKAVVSKL